MIGSERLRRLRALRAELTRVTDAVERTRRRAEAFAVIPDLTERAGRERARLDDLRAYARELRAAIVTASTEMKLKPAKGSGVRTVPLTT